jgi:hypothetical protein
VVAHARYLAAHADKSITPHYLAQQMAAWQSIEARKAKIQAHVMLAGDRKGPSETRQAEMDLRKFTF